MDQLFESLNATYRVTRDTSEMNMILMFDLDSELYTSMDIHEFSGKIILAFSPEERSKRILDYLYSFQELTVDFNNSLASVKEPVPEDLSPDKFFAHFFDPNNIEGIMNMGSPVLTNQVTQRRIIL